MSTVFRWRPLFTHADTLSQTSNSYAISPWNVPTALTIRACAVPIICGNTVVLKTSESSPRSQTLMAEILHEVRISALGIPASETLILYV